MHLYPEMEKSVVTIISGSADKKIKFWSLEVKKTVSSLPNVQMKRIKQIKTSDEVLCCMFSPNGKYIAFALLDFTIKVCFASI